MRDIVAATERALAHRLTTGELDMDVVLATLDPDDLRDIDARSVIKAAADLATDGRHVARANLEPNTGSSPLALCERASAELVAVNTDVLLAAVSACTKARLALRAIVGKVGAP